MALVVCTHVWRSLIFLLNSGNDSVSISLHRRCQCLSFNQKFNFRLEIFFTLSRRIISESHWCSLASKNWVEIPLWTAFQGSASLALQWPVLWLGCLHQLVLPCVSKIVAFVVKNIDTIIFGMFSWLGRMAQSLTHIENQGTNLKIRLEPCNREFPAC